MTFLKELMAKEGLKQKAPASGTALEQHWNTPGNSHSLPVNFGSGPIFSKTPSTLSNLL
jgi:hypothetical protein